MEFGKTDTEQLTQIDFMLPPEPVGNRTILSGKRAVTLKIFVGCPRWGTKDWLGHFYPEHTSDKGLSSLLCKAFQLY